MSEELFYAQLGTEEKRLALGYLFSCILKSRKGSAFGSNSKGFDEDVNVYLAHLLLSLFDPTHADQVKKYIHKSDQDIFRMIEESDDPRFKQIVYRANADNLLISIGIFNNLGTSFKEQHSFYGRNKTAYVGRGKIYYQFAASYSREVGKHLTAVTEVLNKLSSGFEQYTEVLSRMREDYLNLATQHTQDPFNKFQEEIKKFESELKTRGLVDEFLDLYREWKEHGDLAVKERLIQKMKEVQLYSPDFKCDYL
jgi:Skp family chaperone for outer membrane proteins